MVKITDKELIDALKECYKNEGIVDGKTLNDSNNEYPTQPTYSYRFDGGLREACEKANVPYGKQDNWDRELIIEKSEEYFLENDSLNISDFNNSDKLPPSSKLYKYFNSINELINNTSISEKIIKRKKEIKRIAMSNRSSKYNPDDKEALIDHLWWVMKEYGNTKTSTVNSSPGPSTNVYNRIFGSLNNARKEANLDELYRSTFQERIESLPNSYDDDADGYIYVLKMLKGGDEYYYTGMSTNLKNRLSTHARGESKIMLHHENKYDKIKNLNIDILSIVKVENYNKKEEESDEEFISRLKSEEHIMSHKVSSFFNTDKVLGGRS